MTARLSGSDDGTFLWVVNASHDLQNVRLDITPERGPFRGGRLRWGDGPIVVADRRVEVALGARDAAVIELLR